MHIWTSHDPAGPTGSFDNVTGSFATTGSNIFIGNQTIVGNISSSRTVFGTTGSFSHLVGNSPITVGDPVTFQQPITASAGIQIEGTLRTLFTTASIVYSGSNVTQVTQSFGETQQITNITYSGSFADGNPLTISMTGSDGINKLYTLTYSASLVTQIIQS